jgi:uncharacterized protein YndB with AHSA1/START domain
MIETIESIRRDVVVPVSPEKAFEVFTARMTDWWPSAHHIGSAPIEQVVIEPHEGGRWYTRHEDGSETSTGYVMAWEPPERLVITWQIGADWRYDPKLVTTVEISFLAEARDRTRVRLEHRDLERFGPEAPRMRDMFEGPGAWTATLSAYAAAFGDVA